MNFPALKDVLSSQKNIVITGHLNPDGDAIGSSLTIGDWLSSKGHNVTVILPNEAPPALRSVVGYDKILIYMECEKLCRSKIADADIIFSMDYNDISTRIGHMGEYILTLEDKYRILVDHHLNPPLEMYNLSFSDSNVSSTSYLVFHIIEMMGDVDMINLDMANNLYLGMMTDTGNFSYGQLNGNLYRAIGTLVEKGVSPVRINIETFSNQSANRMRLMGYALYEKMVVLPELKSAYIWFTAEELEKFNYTEGDSEGIVNLPLSIKGIVNSAIFVQKNDLIKISLRSQDAEGLDMNKFARTYFIGGGHRNASGGKSHDTIEKTIDIFVKGLEVEIAEQK